MAVFHSCGVSTSHATSSLPDAILDTPISTSRSTFDSIVLAGGCFWGVQAVFQHVKGVTNAQSGYTGGNEKDANYEMVCEGTTGHAEAVKVTYDASEVTLGTLLKIFFSVVHNPTEFNRQGPDHGTQYRSAIFPSSPAQKKIAYEYISQLQNVSAFREPIVTTIEPLTEFYPAESYHQNYAKSHPDNPYIATHDLPKVENLKRAYPDIYVP